MNVVSFIPGPAGLRSWSANELKTLISVYESHEARGHASGWDVGTTELDDPQFYILGPLPELDCALVISRVGRIYVLENGAGQVLAEGPSLEMIAARGKLPLATTKRASLLARFILGLTGLRLAVEERIEPIFVETEEVLIRLAPQLAALV